MGSHLRPFWVIFGGRGVGGFVEGTNPEYYKTQQYSVLVTPEECAEIWRAMRARMLCLLKSQRLSNLDLLTFNVSYNVEVITWL